MKDLSNVPKSRLGSEDIGVTNAELLGMKAVGARLEQVKDGWRATIIREDGGQLREETLNVRRGGVREKGGSLPNEKEALQLGREMAMKDIAQSAPDLDSSKIEVKESPESAT